MFLGIAVAVVVLEVERKALEVSVISVAASLAETGLTPSVAARRLADGHAGQSITLAAMGRHADALEALDRAAVLDAMDYRALHAQAGLPALNEQWSEALDVYDAAIRRAPRVARLHEGRGVTLAQLGRRMEAVQALQTAVALGIEAPAARRSLRQMETTPGYPVVARGGP
jgi:tetratricopeptide (TPR) repeat protein